jgi:hypothetical protein
MPPCRLPWRLGRPALGSSGLTHLLRQAFHGSSPAVYRRRPERLRAARHVLGRHPRGGIVRRRPTRVDSDEPPIGVEVAGVSVSPLASG